MYPFNYEYECEYEKKRGLAPREEANAHLSRSHSPCSPEQGPSHLFAQIHDSSHGICMNIRHTLFISLTNMHVYYNQLSNCMHACVIYADEKLRFHSLINYLLHVPTHKKYCRIYDLYLHQNLKFIY